MTPTTPKGDRSTVADILAINAPGALWEVRIISSAWRAAQPMWLTALETSKRESLSGFPVSSEINSEICSILLMMYVLHASKVFLRPANPSATQSCEAVRACATTVATSLALNIG